MNLRSWRPFLPRRGRDYTRARKRRPYPARREDCPSPTLSCLSVFGGSLAPRTMREPFFDLRPADVVLLEHEQRSLTHRAFKRSAILAARRPGCTPGRAG